MLWDPIPGRFAITQDVSSITGRHDTIELVIMTNGAFMRAFSSRLWKTSDASNARSVRVTAFALGSKRMLKIHTSAASQWPHLSFAVVSDRSNCLRPGG